MNVSIYIYFVCIWWFKFFSLINRTKPILTPVSMLMEKNPAYCLLLWEMGVNVKGICYWAYLNTFLIGECNWVSFQLQVIKCIWIHSKKAFISITFQQHVNCFIQSKMYKNSFKMMYSLYTCLASACAFLQWFNVLVYLFIQHDSNHDNR